MKLRNSRTLTVAGIGIAAVLVIGGTAAAASQITAHDLATGAVNSRVIENGSVHHRDLTTTLAGKIAAGKNVPATLPAGTTYAVAKYDVGDVNGGAVASVACPNLTDVAISGGVQTLALGDNGTGNNVPVSSSFPGRMDWSTYTPKPDRLDGWIVQFGAEVANNNPLYVDIYALCVPGADVPVTTTYTESGN
jgi:D-aminopeptidase